MGLVAVVRTKKRFHLVAGFSTSVFATSVEEYLNDGWTRVGLPFVFGEQLCQAVEKSEDTTS